MCWIRLEKVYVQEGQDWGGNIFCDGPGTWKDSAAVSASAGDILTSRWYWIIFLCQLDSLLCWDKLSRTHEKYVVWLIIYIYIQEALLIICIYSRSCSRSWRNTSYNVYLLVGWHGCCSWRNTSYNVYLLVGWHGCCAKLGWRKWQKLGRKTHGTFSPRSWGAPSCY
jgi:hypothetical protein